MSVRGSRAQHGRLAIQGSVHSYQWMVQPHNTSFSLRSPWTKVLGSATKQRRAHVLTIWEEHEFGCDPSMQAIPSGG